MINLSPVLSRKIKNCVTNFVLIIISVMGSLLLCEFGLRIYQKLTAQQPFIRDKRTYYDRELGWLWKEITGDVATSKKKILILGDSFTHGVSIPDEDLYCRILGEKLNAEIFVYAGIGYGSLQEYLVLLRSFEKIKPDLLLLQVCTNDFIDNSWEMESQSLFFNTRTLRPYLRDGKIQKLFPAHPSGAHYFLSHFRLYYWVFDRITNIAANMTRKNWSEFEEHLSEQFVRQDFLNAVKTTSILIGWMKQTMGSVPFVAFTADQSEAGMPYFRLIFEKNQVDFIETVPKAIREIEHQGQNCRIDGAHWNKTGHQICAQVLAEQLVSRGYMQAPGIE
ncbi:MAG TPA: SGNH/GDSL hydrolase family protein [Candidatus Omnitrophota bacterium]|nr:SGNH/GDSL hydrolase family protein [Candidatus Omnitrophota bacterium]